MKEKWCITSPKQEADKWNPMLKVSPWSGHRNFVYDLLNFMEPEKIIELGTHYGCSFFSMCQSIKDNQLSHTEIYAVDTWQGDEQAGLYGEEVWNKVNETKEHAYSEVNSKFLRMYFDEASELFDKEIFDLIHIDGLHTYEAVSHDFSIWLPKLKKNGIFLFHDIHSYLNYGSDKFWKELQNRYKENFEFMHSWGLGILFPKGHFWYKKFLEQNFEDKIKLYEYKAVSERKEIEVVDLTAMANERYEAIQNQSKMIKERDTTIEAQAKLCEERYRVMQEQGEVIAKKDVAIVELQKQKEDFQRQIEEKTQEISDLTTMAKERYKAIQNQSQMIEERDTEIEAQAKLCEERYTVMQKQEKIIKEKEQEISDLTALANERYKAIQNQSQMIEERDTEIKAQAKLCEERYTVMQKQGNIIEEKEREISSLTTLANERYEAIQNQSKMIEERDATIEAQAKMCEERYAVMQEQGNIIAEKDVEIAELIKQINELKVRIRKNANWRHKKYYK